ncbi:type II toxin-antitoxin system RelE/ParE family toxin [Corynebacterium callunae]|uniref:type II toxin-antitoxin system RelE family toxin n=1 Tax=Corynebacterium callunae TaxID=1721 RepID=UPI003982246F
MINAIETLASNPRPAGAKMLQGGAGELRIRVGAFRVIYEIHDEKLIVLVLHLGHRKKSIDIFDYA